MLGKTTKTYKELYKCRKVILNGTFISIDPSIGSRSSMPAWAVYKKGRKIAADTFDINADATLHQRAQELHSQVYRLYKQYKPKLLVYEDIPDRAYGGRSATGHASLLKAVGIILGVPGPREGVGLRPTVWIPRARKSYVKGDMQDAIEIGYVAIKLAKEIEKGIE